MCGWVEVELMRGWVEVELNVWIGGGVTQWMTG